MWLQKYGSYHWDNEGNHYSTWAFVLETTLLFPMYIVTVLSHISRTHNTNVTKQQFHRYSFVNKYIKIIQWRTMIAYIEKICCCCIFHFISIFFVVYWQIVDWTFIYRKNLFKNNTQQFHRTWGFPRKCAKCNLPNPLYIVSICFCFVNNQNYFFMQIVNWLTKQKWKTVSKIKPAFSKNNFDKLEILSLLNFPHKFCVVF